MLPSLVLIVSLVAVTNAGNVTKLTPNAKILEGFEAEQDLFPFMALVLHYQKRNWKSCGGSIISDRYILTAAHCTYRKVFVQVYIGSNIHSDGILFNIDVHNNIINHENFDPKTRLDNISLIKTSFPIIFNHNVRQIRLPLIIIPSSEYAYLGEEVFAAGWGFTNKYQPSISKVLRYITSTVLSKIFCERVYKQVTKDHICTSTTGGKAPSNGDAGGPLILPTNDIFGPILIGVINSFYPRFENYPATSTRVSSYLYWIKEKTGIAYY